MPPPGENDLEALALRLAKDGPVKTLPTPRRVRILFNGAYIVDTDGTAGALFVWEHPFYPQLYLPVEALRKPDGFDVEYTVRHKISDDRGKDVASLQQVAVRSSGRHSDDIARTCCDIVQFSPGLDGKGKALANMVKVKFDVVGTQTRLFLNPFRKVTDILLILDQWFEEDTPIFVHPKDPFKRVDIVSSSRPLRISVNGKVVAETHSSMHLYETSLPVRYYMPLTAINAAVLRPSKTRTQCPYKGEAEYYDVIVDDEEFNDIVWFYSRPTVECTAVAGLCCFFNEKVEISIKQGGEWKLLEKPQTPWS
ncbi:hypothetical protein MBLNU459_g5763t1 [Dothideomycetes sp. NU459]